MVVNGANVAAQRRFKNMYNDLPAQRQTESIRKLITKVNKSDFINFDKVVTEGITTYTGVNAGLFTSLARGFADLTGFGEGNELDAKSKTTNQSASIEKSKLFSANRYIKFDLAVDILNNNNEVVSYNMGGKNEVSFHIDINTSVIGAFRYMFSTDPKKLIIPGEIPDFSVYFLNADDVTQYTNGDLESGGAKLTPIDANADGVRFVQSSILHQNGIAEIAYHWGYLKDLYVNFDMFVEKLSQSNKLIGEVLLDILNEMAAAANGFWNFQIVEKTSPTSGKTVLTVIDEHFVGIPPKGTVQRFDHNGADSIFLEASLDISIPGEMANKIIMDRLDYTVNPHSPSVKANYPNKTAIFNSETDIFLETVRASGGTGGGPPPVPPAPTPAPRTEAVILAEMENIVPKNGTDKRGVPYLNRAGVLVYPNTVEADRYDALLDELNKLRGTQKIDAKKNLNKNIEKIDIVPKPVINAFTAPLKDVVITDHDEFVQRFSIFCLIDVPFFDMLKQEAFANKVAGKGLLLQGKGLSQPLPIKYSFKTLGISGLRRGDMFNIDGIPSRYKERGLFQITELEQNVSDNKWYTNVTGEYRQII